MSSIQMDRSPKVMERKRDITSWLEEDITQLGTRAKNRYHRRKSAIEDYFETDTSVEEISLRYRLSSSESVLEMVQWCLMLHADGQPWGFRALVPGVKVVDHSAQRETCPVDEQDVDALEQQTTVPLNAPDGLESETISQSAASVAAPVQVSDEVPAEDIPTGSYIETTPTGELLQVSPAIEDGEESPETMTGDIQPGLPGPIVAEPLAPAQELQEAIQTENLSGDEDETPTLKQRAIRVTVPDIEAEKDEDGTEVVVPDVVTEQSKSLPDEEDGEQDRAETPTGKLDVVRLVEMGNNVEMGTEDGSSEESEQERLERVDEIETVDVPSPDLEKTEQAEPASSAAMQTSTSQGESLEENIETPSRTEEQNSAAEKSATASAKATAVFVKEEEAEETPTAELERLRRDSRQLTGAELIASPTQSMADGRYRVTGKQAVLRRSLLRRWERQGKRKQHRRWVKIISAAIVVSILVILLIPLAVGVVGYNAYTNIKGVTSDGVNHLLAVKALIPANKNDITSILDPTKLANAKTELVKAQSDFLQLQDMVNRPDIESLLNQFAPEYSGKLDEARRLVQVALDVSRMGQELIGVAQLGTNIIHGSPLASGSTKPLITADDINNIEAAVVHSQYYINDIQLQMSQVNLSQLPLAVSQRNELTKALGEISGAQDLITQVQTMIGPVSWLLGVDHQRRFLVQTLDRGELRPSGGFEGQYGVLSLQGGRMGSFGLTDIAELDYGGNGNELGATPPSQYSWMNFGNFGVRDANVSADYPTTAQIVMHYFQAEGGGPVDGDIQITPVVIEQLLQITGPLKIPEYNETVTAQNLENKLHQYQQDPRFISIQENKTGTDTHQTRKAFTNLVGSLLLSRVHHLQISQLLDFAKVLQKDLKSRDLQIYFTNPVVEQLLQQNADSGAMPTFTKGTDGFMVVQSNISISKAAQYVHSTFNDQVSLDGQGGATHSLTITLDYQQTGPVYGYNTYADYLRVYAPAGATLLNANGFNSGATLCTPNSTTTAPPSSTGKKTTQPPPSSGGGSYTDIDGFAVIGCSQYYSSYPDTSVRYCSDGDYRLGRDGMHAKPWAIQAPGGPTSSTSDLPGYSMWGGLTLTPKNCVSTITLSWYVPHVVQKKAGATPYQMIVGHQAGWPFKADISVDTSALRGVKSFTFAKSINDDTLLALPALPLPKAPKKPTAPTPAVTPTTSSRKQ